MLEPSRQVAQRKMQRLASRVEAVRDHMEDVRDHMAFVMDGLRRGEFQWTPQLIPILLQVVEWLKYIVKYAVQQLKCGLRS